MVLLIVLATLSIAHSLVLGRQAEAGSPGGARQWPVQMMARSTNNNTNTSARPDDPERNKAIIARVWKEHRDLGVAIAGCESQLQANALNVDNPDGSHDAGLFQINSIHGLPTEQLLDPVANTEVAYRLFQEQGTTPWDSSRSCWAK